MQGLALKNNVVCIPKEKELIDYESDFFKYHYEYWIFNDENVGEELGDVFIEEKRPQPELIGGKYQLELTATGGYNESVKLYQSYDTQQNRNDLLEEIADYMRNH